MEQSKFNGYKVTRENRYMETWMEVKFKYAPKRKNPAISGLFLFGAIQTRSAYCYDSSRPVSLFLCEIEFSFPYFHLHRISQDFHIVEFV